MLSAIGVVRAQGTADRTRLHAEQIDAANGLLVGAARERVVELISSGQCDIWLSAEQILVAIQVAMESGSPDVGQSVDDDLLGRFLLGINDLLLAHAPKTPEDLSIYMALRRGGLLRNEQPRYLIGRWYDLLVTRAQKHAEAGSLNIAEIFQSATGMTIPDLMGFCTAFIANMIPATSAKELMEWGYPTLIPRIEAQVRNPDQLAAIHGQLFATPEEYTTSFASNPSSLGSSTMMPFMERPFVQLANGAAVPVALSLVLNTISMGAYWILVRQVGRDDPRHGVQNLNKLVGQVHQEYLSDLLQASAPSSGPIVVYDEAAVQAASPRGRKRGGQPPFDAAIVDGDRLFLIEMYARSLSRATIESGDPDAYREEIREHYLHKVRQLGRAITDIRAGIWAIPGVVFSDRARRSIPR